MGSSRSPGSGSLVGLGLGLFLTVGCATCPRPGFVGVPEAMERSPDLVLPLVANDRGRLVDFLASGGRPRTRRGAEDEVDPARRRAVERQYGALLDALSAGAPTTEDLRGETGRVARLFDDPAWVLSVHDARVDEVDLDSGLARGWVKGEWVFAFYALRLDRVSVEHESCPAIDTGTDTVWRLTAASPGVFEALVVFHRNFAVPTRAEP